MWNDTKNGKGGDVFTWIAYNEGLDEQNNFPEILRIAADFAGLEMQGLTDEDRALIEEGKDVTATLNEVTEIYHKNLLNNPEALQQVKEDWDFGLDEVKAFKMGYATGEDLKHIENSRLVKAGLGYKNSNTEHFIHRIMYPYLIRDNTVYFIGKKTPLTPKDKDGEEEGKYKKLRTHDKKHDVSKHVNNKFLFGEDTIRKSEYVLIAEGISDAVSAIQRGHPTISAVTTHIKGSEIDRVSKVIGERPVKICLDIDKGGRTGARDMAEVLTLRGNEVSIITLTDSEGKKDFDLNDYFRTHTKEDFDELIENAVGYWNYILNAETPKECKSLPFLTRLNKLKKFISNDLHQMPDDFWRAFVENDVLLAFGVNKKDAKAVIDACEKSRKEASADEEGEDADEEVPSTDGKIPPLEVRLQAYPENVIKKANEILDTGDPFEYIMKVWNTLHVGDRELGEMLLCSVATTQILNAGLGLHNKPSGDAESGKSHGCLTMGKVFPEWKFVSTTFSAKNLYYNTRLHPGVIVYTDDIDLTDKNSEVIQTLKKATADFETPTCLDTVIDGEGKTLAIPERTTFWLSSVTTIGDVQLGTRFIYSSTEKGTEHNHEVSHKQNGRCVGKSLEGDNEEILVCRCILEYICDQLYYVFSPYGFVSSWSEESEKRNHEKFIDVLMSVTVFKYRQRETVHGCLVGTLEDWKKAVAIYSPVAQNNSCLLSDEEIIILYSIHEMGKSYGEGVPHKRLLAYMTEKGLYNKSDSTLKRTLLCKVGAENTGFKEKVPGFAFEKVSMSKLDEKGLEIRGAGNTSVICYTYDGDLFDGIEPGANVVDVIKNSVFITCDYSIAEAYGELFKEDPVKAHSLKENTATLENWKRSLRNHKDPSEITRNPQNSNPMNSELSSLPIPIDNSVVYNNNLRNQESSNMGVGGISACVLEGEIDEETHAELRDGFSPENMNSENSEAPVCDHARDFSDPVLNSEAPVCDHAMNSEESLSVYGNMHILHLLRRALIKLAKTAYHSIVLDLDEFIRDFNSRTPEYKKTLGSFVVENEARKLNIVGWR